MNELRGVRAVDRSYHRGAGWAALLGFALLLSLGAGACASGAGLPATPTGRPAQGAASAPATEAARATVAPSGAPTAPPPTTVAAAPQPPAQAQEERPKGQAPAAGAAEVARPALARVALTIPTIT